MKDWYNLDSVSYKRSLAIGVLLGSAHSRRKSSKTGAKAEYAICHSFEQQDLAEWKAEEFSRLYGKKVLVRSSQLHNKAYFGLSQTGRLRVIHDWFHRDSQKVITGKIRFMDHPIGLGLLLCDAGSVRKRKKQHKDGTIYYLKPSLSIVTSGFDTPSLECLLAHVGRVCGAVGSINPERRWQKRQLKPYYRVNFNSENSQKLWDYVGEWIPPVPSMLSKFAYAIEQFGIGNNGRHLNSQAEGEEKVQTTN